MTEVSSPALITPPHTWSKRLSSAFCSCIIKTRVVSCDQNAPTVCFTSNQAPSNDISSALCLGHGGCPECIKTPFASEKNNSAGGEEDVTKGRRCVVYSFPGSIVSFHLRSVRCSQKYITAQQFAHRGSKRPQTSLKTNFASDEWHTGFAGLKKIVEPKLPFFEG